MFLSPLSIEHISPSAWIALLKINVLENEPRARSPGFDLLNENV
jgi:hypothetical protein